MDLIEWAGMKLLLVKGGRFAHREAESWGETYAERLGRWHGVETLIYKEGDLVRRLEEWRKEPTHRIILLDEKGTRRSTAEWAAALREWRDQGTVRKIIWVIGGSYGFSEAERQLAHEKWSLGPLTLAGDVAWLVLCEQIYRAFTVLEGHPYHHG